MIKITFLFFIFFETFPYKIVNGDVNVNSKYDSSSLFDADVSFLLSLEIFLTFEARIEAFSSTSLVLRFNSIY